MGSTAAAGGPSDYVELDRRFVALDPSQDREAAALNSYLSGFSDLSESLGWPEVLQHRLVVILGEPGSGKSYELRQRCGMMKSSGEFSFLLDLERLVDEPLTEVLSPADKEQFDRWRRGNRECVFFLDSVDEAKLRRQSDFHRALTRLSEGIGAAGLKRARFVIGSRISAWCHQTDRQEVDSRLRWLPPPDKEADARNGGVERADRESVLVVQLQRLNSARVKQLAAAASIADAEAFVTALNEQFAWEFAGRPLDVQALLAYWKKHGQLGSLTDIIAFDVKEKLREWTPRAQNDPLTEEQAMHGAHALAAATVLCRHLQIAVPDDAARLREVDGIRASECLPDDWKENEIAALLSRPLFDSASYGTIRFHHRRIGEYLAAQWFTERVKDGCTMRAIEQVVFETVDGELTLRPSLAGVAAWLCGGGEPWNQTFRAWVLAAAPDIHLEHGDASRLPIQYRRELLLAWVKRNEGRQRVWVRSSPEALRRLGVAELATDVSTLLADKRVAVDVREELAMVVRFARLVDCLPALQSIVSDAAESEDLKRFAMRAMRDMSPADVRRAVWDTAVQHWTRLPAGLCGDVIEAMHPDVIGPDQIVQLLARVDDDASEHRSLTWSLARHFENCLSAQQAGRLLDALLTWGTASNQDWWEDLLPPLLRRFLESPTLTADDCSIAARALHRFGGSDKHRHRDRDEVEGIDAATRRLPGVRKALFKMLIAGMEPKPAGYLWFDGFDLVRFDAGDFDWLCADVEAVGANESRQFALRMALQILPWKKQSRTQRRKLHRAIGGNPSLAAILRDHRVKWRWRPFWRRSGGQPWFYRKQRYLHLLRHQWERLQAKWNLWRFKSRLRSGREVRWIADLCLEARDTELKWETKCWDEMAKERGSVVMRAVQRGCGSLWRKFSPKLPHEKPVANESDKRNIIGLAAIDLLASEGKLNELSAADASLATRYAVNELNGFPDWLTRLAELKSAAVAAVLNECVAGEWLYAADRQHTYDVLADLAWMGGPLAELVEDTVIDLLEQHDPPNLELLSCALSVLLKAGGRLDRLKAIALARCGSLAVDEPQFAWWAAVGLQLAAIETITLLEQRVGAASAPKKVVANIGALLESRGRAKLPQLPNPSFLAPQALRRLIPLAYQYVRREDDLDRAGKGAYSPTERDDAQDFRNSLLSRLAQSDSVDAIGVMKELLSEAILAPDRDWIRHLIDERRRGDADGKPWVPADVRTFAIDYEAEAKTADDLFRIVVNRLQDLQDDVERSDNSLREEVTPGADEYVLRRWLARKLNERSRQRYTVPQESEIDAEQRPDIRAENPKTDPVSIEVKWAEKWSLAKLLERLENQLVGQYLRAHNSRHGLYFLAIDGRGGAKQWKADDGRLVPFEEMVQILRARAKQIAATRADVESLEVCTIDFRPPMA